MKTKNFPTLFATLAAFTSCTMAPKYITPKAPVSFQEENKNKEKITTISWDQYFDTPDLQRIIRLALENNRDLRIANLNIENSKAAHAIARSNLFPTINATANTARQGVPGAFAAFTPKKQFRANLNSTSYEIDFFGRLQSLKKAALETFLATKQARNITRIALISETANSYAQFLLDNKILNLAEENLAAQTQRYKFTELRLQNGIDSTADLLVAQTLLSSAISTRENYAKLVAQDKNALMVLTGIFDEKSLPKLTDINDIKINEDLLDNVPSNALLSRPDIKQAEHVLKSANANIGAARAAFFPSITLTGSYGYASREMNSLFDSRTWVFTPQINLPIFTGGKNIANLKVAEIEKKIEIAQYEKTIQTAFSEASNELAARDAALKQLKAYDDVLKAREKSLSIYENRRNAGIASGLTLLDIKIAALTAKQDQMSAKKEYIANLINLYKVLGGGSDIEDEE